MITELEQFLEVTRAAGLVESEGEFTVDLGKAVESLHQFTLQQPETYFRYLVASAVARGASFVTLETSPRALTIRDDGRALSFAELKTTFPSMMVRQTAENAAQRLLGIGLCGARSLGFTAAEVRSPKAVLRFVKGRLEVHDEPAGAETIIRITERRSLAKVVSHFLKKDGWNHLKVGSRCLRLARANITIDGVSVAEPHLCEKGPVWVINSKLGDPSQGRDILGASSTELPYFGYLETQFEGGVPLSFVVHGIAFEEEHPSAGIGGVVYCDDLKLDASFLSLVKDQQFQVLSEDLFQHADKALMECLEKAQDFPGAQAQLCRQVSHSGQPKEWLERLSEVSVTQADEKTLTFRQMTEQVGAQGFLKMEESFGEFEPVIRFFFPSLIDWEQVTHPSAREQLSQPSLAVLKFPGLPMALRWEPETPNKAFECLYFSQVGTPMGMQGPRGFQFLALQPEARLQFGFANFDKRVLQVGSLVFRYLSLGVLEPSETSEFFLNLLEWGIRNQNMTRRDIDAFLNALSFRTEGGERVEFSTLRSAGAVVYTLETDQLSGSSSALRLTVREFDVLYDSGRLSLYHALERDDSSPWSPV